MNFLKCVEYQNEKDGNRNKYCEINFELPVPGWVEKRRFFKSFKFEDFSVSRVEIKVYNKNGAKSFNEKKLFTS